MAAHLGHPPLVHLQVDLCHRAEGHQELLHPTNTNDDKVSKESGFHASQSFYLNLLELIFNLNGFSLKFYEDKGRTLRSRSVMLWLRLPMKTRHARLPTDGRPSARVIVQSKTNSRPIKSLNTIYW
jgi:hypothetical protein